MYLGCIGGESVEDESCPDDEREGHKCDDNFEV
jgi:hypothetical protein